MVIACIEITFCREFVLGIVCHMGFLHWHVNWVIMNIFGPVLSRHYGSGFRPNLVVYATMVSISPNGSHLDHRYKHAFGVVGTKSVQTFSAEKMVLGIRLTGSVLRKHFA